MLLATSTSAFASNDLLSSNYDFATTSGTVTDSDGEPLIGVSILIKGTSNGTATNFDGSYSLNMPDGSNTLVFSYTGYKPQEVNIDGCTAIDVILEQDAELLQDIDRIEVLKDA